MPATSKASSTLRISSGTRDEEYLFQTLFLELCLDQGLGHLLRYLKNSFYFSFIFLQKHWEIIPENHPHPVVAPFEISVLYSGTNLSCFTFHMYLFLDYKDVLEPYEVTLYDKESLILDVYRDRLPSSNFVQAN